MYQISSPLPQFFDKAGTSLDNGYIYIGTAGANPETSPITVYWDKAGTQPAAQPIRTVNGYMARNGKAAKVWTSANDFSITVREGDSTLVYSEYSATSVLTLEDSLSLGTGSSLVGFKQTGTGAIERTAQSKMQECISAYDFGLSSSNTAAQNVTAIAAALVEAGARKCALYFPGGDTCLINDEFTVPAGVSIFGDGWFSCLQQTAAGKNIFILQDYCGVSNMHLKFSGAGNNSDFTKQNAIYASGAKMIDVSSNFLELLDIHCGVHLRNTYQPSVRGNFIFGGTWDGSTAGAAATASDIIFYSGVGGGRAIIDGNFCLSNNSQGIFYSALGYDADTAITNNVCISMNASASAESSSGGVRRHGIILSYVGATQSRASVIGNICRNTRWTGIYVQGSGVTTGGQISVVGNVCSNNGYETGNSLSGGIYITSNGGETISGNTITDFKNNIAATGGITVTCPATGGAYGTLVSDNTIANSLASGISVNNKMRDCVVRGNQVVNAALNDILVSLSSGDTGLGGFEISNNTCIRANTTSISINFNQANGAKRSRIFQNKIRGSDYTVVASTNIGVNLSAVTQPVEVFGNHIENFYYGANVGSLLLAGTRYTTSGVTIDNNRIETCTQGIGASGNAASCTFVVTGNTFESCTAKLGVGTAAGFAALYEGRRAGSKYDVFVTAIPTNGTWALGDRALNQAGTVGQPKAWTNTTAGSPGTFTSEGNL
jgi:hypothetical protein